MASTSSISSSGIGSGLDVNSIVSQLMTIEQRPLTLLTQKEASYQAKLSAYGSLKSSMSTLQSAITSLKSSSLYNAMSAKVADTSVASASAVSTAVAGTYNLNVTALAKAQNLTTKTDFSTHTGDISTANGKIKIELGTYSGGTFTADTAKTPVTIEVTAGNSSLDEIRDQINSVSAGVRASVVYIGKNGGTDVYKLALTAKDVGAANSMRITVMDSNDNVLTNNTGLAQLSYDPSKAAGSGNEYDIKTPAQDAQFTVDGIALTRSSNTVTDAINGVTLSLAKEATATTVTIGRDTASVKSAITTFVKAYNDVNKLAHDLTAYNAENKKSSALTGDSGVRSLQNSLRQMVGQETGSAGSSIKRLADVGVTLQRDGSLAFDSSKFDSAISRAPDEVAAMFSSTGTSTQGIAVRMAKLVDGMMATNGLLATRTDGINRSIADIGKQRDALNLRLTQIESRYRAQYTALDTLVASMQRTSSYLTQQLASLPSASG